MATTSLKPSEKSTFRKSENKGYGITPTGLWPSYPRGFRCSPLTSLYASMIDIDGSRRDQPHSGVDGGRLNDRILAPGAGVVKAAWRANWGWGSEGALLLIHSREALGLSEGPLFYYSEFDHLRYSEVRGFEAGQIINRGDLLARVFRPGGDRQYLEEVHWEVWEVEDDSQLSWRDNEFGGRFWVNKTARLIDPLYMLARNTPPGMDGAVSIPPFISGNDYSSFRGFTYILPCERSK